METIAAEWMEPLAQSLGYTNKSTAMAMESMSMYDALMSAYGKDEFPE